MVSSGGACDCNWWVFGKCSAHYLTQGHNVCPVHIAISADSFQTSVAAMVRTRSCPACTCNPIMLQAYVES